MINGKCMMDMMVKRNVAVSPSCRLLALVPVGGQHLPTMLPGQFVEVKVDMPGVLLRRPISVCNVVGDELWLLVRRAGKATAELCDMREGEVFNVVLPLGNGFSVPECGNRVLMVGGGVGIAPMLYYGHVLAKAGADVSVLVASKTREDLMLVDDLRNVGQVYIATDDGSEGHKGFAATHPALRKKWDLVACCGPLPMMKSVARVCQERENRCEVSLENLMACGLGACLCCVEPTVDKGNVCVCTEGPVFDVNVLKWQN